ncbi:MAG: HIT domain-containing protein [Candidatus Binatia bacterium]|nr:HIT domain-containing protein [Candidatus Binatia bacterium]
MQSCIFCKIVRGEAPAHRVYEDECVIVFLDIFPVSAGHTLVVTKAHYADLFEADAAALVAVAAVAKKVAHALRAVVRPAGLMVFQLNGAAAGQTVFHYHMHLMPRAEGEPLRLHARQAGDPQELAELAAKLRAALAASEGSMQGQG